MAIAPSDYDRIPPPPGLRGSGAQFLVGTVPPHPGPEVFLVIWERRPLVRSLAPPSEFYFQAVLARTSHGPVVALAWTVCNGEGSSTYEHFLNPQHERELQLLGELAVQRSLTVLVCDAATGDVLQMRVFPNDTVTNAFVDDARRAPRVASPDFSRAVKEFQATTAFSG